jgi:hypothetical protein
MCLALFICSLDGGFLDKGTTANDFTQIQKQYLLPMSLRICLSELAMQDSRLSHKWAALITHQGEYHIWFIEQEECQHSMASLAYSYIGGGYRHFCTKSI